MALEPLAEFSLHGHKRPPRRSAQQTENDASAGKLGADFDDAYCLLNSEVYELLSAARIMHVQAGVEIDKNPIFEKSLEYAKRFNNYKEENARRVRVLLEDAKLTSFELTTIANLDLAHKEAMAFLPSLEQRTRRSVEDDDDGQDDREDDSSDRLFALIESLGEFRGRT